MIDFENNPAFKSLLKEKSPQILARIREGIQEHENFKKLHNLFVTYIEERPLKSLTAVVFGNDDIENLTDHSKDKLFGALDSQACVINDYVELDRDLNVLKIEKKAFDNNKTAEEFYKETSLGKCVFLVTPLGVNPFVNGENIGSLVFLNLKDLRRHKELKEMDQINELFDMYRRHITYRYNYETFFATNSAKKSLHKHLVAAGRTKLSQEDFLEANRQLLNNKPENRFRESLRAYLKDNMSNEINFVKEYLLESFKRLDINIIDNYGDLYFIEVKWVGSSIGAEGDSFGKEFKATDINPDAIKQTVRYIHELYKDNQNVRLGYLVVFDARDGDFSDTVEKFDKAELETGTERYYRIFHKIPDFKVKNNHPS